MYMRKEFLHPRQVGNCSVLRICCASILFMWPISGRHAHSQELLSNCPKLFGMMYVGGGCYTAIESYDIFVKKCVLLGATSQCLSILSLDHCHLDYGLLLTIGLALPQLQVRSLPDVPL